MSFCRRLLNFGLESDEFDLDQSKDFDFDLHDVCLETIRDLEKKFGIDVLSIRDKKDKKRRREMAGVDNAQGYGGLLPHPYLDSPRYDGADTNVQPSPNLNSDTEFALREQPELRMTPGLKPGATLPKPRPY